MKTIQKIGVILLILMVSVAIFTPNAVNADASGALSNVTATDVGDAGLGTIIGNILGFLQVASGLFAVLMIALTGFNYIVSTPEVKEEMKKKMLPIIVGIVLVFGAVTIGKFLLNITSSAT